jgi:inhibitor of KinA
MKFAALGDSAVLVTLGEGIDLAGLRAVRTLAQALEKARIPGIVDVVPAYSTVAVFYSPAAFATGDADPYGAVCGAIEACAREGGVESKSTRLRRTFRSDRLVEIPVCYGGELGPDLEALAEQCGLSPAEVVRRHSKAEYRVHAIGFAPGFAYLAGLPEKLHTPRRATPREAVPAGSVGIGGAQTGVYPLVTPGGWNIIGRTPLALFRLKDPHPSLLRMGDRVAFKPITAKEFASWK